MLLHKLNTACWNYIMKIMHFVFVDESGVNRWHRRQYARVKRGVRVYDTKPGTKYKLLLNTLGRILNIGYVIIFFVSHF